MILVKLKVFPPFTNGPQTIEKTLYLEDNAKIENLLALASEQGILKAGSVLKGNSVKEGVVILVNGRTVFDLKYPLNNGDKVAIMPLVPGG